jgi:hypothetical protein
MRPGVPSLMPCSVSVDHKAAVSARWLSSSRGSTLSIPRNSVILLPLGKVYPTSRCGQLWLRQMSTATGRSADLTFSNYHCRQAPRDGRSLHVRKWVKMRWISWSHLSAEWAAPDGVPVAQMRRLATEAPQVTKDVLRPLPCHKRSWTLATSIVRNPAPDN